MSRCVPARALLILVLAFLAGSASVASAEDPRIKDVHVVRGSATVHLSSGAAVITFTGEGFAPSSDVRLTVDSSNRGFVRTAANGTFETTVRVYQPGPVSLAAVGVGPTGGVRVVSANLTVSRLAPAPTSRQRTKGLPSQVYRDLGAGLAFVLLCVVVAVAVQALRRAPVSSP